MEVGGGLSAAARLSKIASIVGRAVGAEKSAAQISIATRDARLLTEVSEANQSLRGATKNRHLSADEKIQQTIRSPAVDGAAVARRVDNLWQNKALTLDEKVKGTFGEYLEQRIQEMPKVRQELTRKALADLKRPEGEAASYRYHTGDLTVGNAYANEVISYHSVLVHELEHLAQMGIVPPEAKLKALIKRGLMLDRPFKGRLVQEFEAIGAQWDFLQAIPPVDIARAIDAVKADKNLSKSAREMLVADLQDSSLTRDEFLRRVPTKHGYTSKNLVRAQVVDRTIQLFMYSVLGTMGTVMYKTK